MTIPIATITSFRTAYNPFSRASRPCRLFLGMLRTPGNHPRQQPDSHRYQGQAIAAELDRVADHDGWV
ncbi:uncharacterized protein N7515_008606 [Penicillium bovifimosum]|uniref:Uncharacterized protein n=1 Tax=Penicillium bovifimosum TaxID=126998 RepID=A0A9W9KXW1_9EURO|nr:uncharacterized protein N7515_008606 [Penicillium bovifimosum]KAJ5124781.1 hypothetical protein N7515_008606 [Penicillium bovifimosum]